MKINITREIDFPHLTKLERFRRMPELGPKILFFSGGSALYRLSRLLVGYTHNSIHVVTPFDSGGSSAKLRDEFDMPAIGDIRHRLMALADQSHFGNPEIFSLFAYRLPKESSQEALRDELSRMCSGKHPLIACIPNPMRKLIRNHLQKFEQYASSKFDLRGASIGNLILAAGYLDNRRHMDTVVYLFSKLVEVRGIVRPVVNISRHLCVRLENGEIICGQHRFTGKERRKIDAKIESIHLVQHQASSEPAPAAVRKKMTALIGTAELICYPMGSFYSSILATLLPKGVGKAISLNGSPKVFIPNTGDDPECFGLTVMEQIEKLLHILQQDDPSRIAPHRVLNFVLLDENKSLYKGRLDRAALEARGIQIVRGPLVSPASAPYVDEQRLLPMLLSFC